MDIIEAARLAQAQELFSLAFSHNRAREKAIQQGIVDPANVRFFIWQDEEGMDWGSGYECVDEEGTYWILSQRNAFTNIWSNKYVPKK